MQPALPVSRTGPVRYPGLMDRNARRHAVDFGEVALVPVLAGDLVMLSGLHNVASCLCTAICDITNRAAPEAIGLATAEHGLLGGRRLDMRDAAPQLALRGIDLPALSGAELAQTKDTADGRLVLRADRAATLVLALPEPHDWLSLGGGGGVTVDVRPGSDGANAAPLPLPLGRVADEWRLPAGTARAYEVKAGQMIQILDVEGQQCSDFMAMRVSALDAGIERHIDATVTRSMTGHAYPGPGLHDKFFDQDMTPLLSVRQDTVGRHDTFALACTAYGYEERGFPGHVNCSDNISDAYAPFGIGRRKAWPAVNLFFNTWFPDGTYGLASDEAWSRPGDYVVMEALTDLVCVSTACPDDVDPINNWNPTDVHVRIYDPSASVPRAIRHRATVEDPGRMTRNSAFHSRTAPLTRTMAVARNLWLPQRYDATGTTGEYWATKRAVTLQDMSSLRKFDIMGPDAQALLQHVMTRDVTKLAQYRGTYALICDARGGVVDDGTLFRITPDVFRWMCGSEASQLHMEEQAAALGLKVRIKALGEHLPNLALQGPASAAVLNGLLVTKKHVPALENVTWFGATIGRFGGPEGPAVMVTRSGYTGQLGYEIFCAPADAEAVWDALMEAGAPHGITPMGGDALEILRIEAGLMAAGTEFDQYADALEAGLGFAIDFAKPDFLGRAALERNRGAERRRLVGLILGGDDAPGHGDAVYQGRDPVGVVTSAARSPELGCAIAMARVAIELSTPGTEVEIGRLDGTMKRLPATVTTLPFLDPRRTLARVNPWKEGQLPVSR